MLKYKKLIIFLSLVAILISAFVITVRPKYVVPILMYHYFHYGATARDSLVVSPETFERQMAFLKNHHYNIISLESLAALIRDNKKIPERAIVITMDDGYKSILEYAFPILEKYQFPATVFVIVNEIGSPRHLSWQEMRKMQSSGLITIGSHSLGPEPLVNIKSEQSLKSEIFDSKRIIEDKLKVKVNTFSYPEGMFNPKIRQLVIDAGYTVAVATNPGSDSADRDLFALKRLRISENSANLLSFAGVTSGFYTFIKEYKKRRHEKK